MKTIHKGIFTKAITGTKQTENLSCILRSDWENCMPREKEQCEDIQGYNTVMQRRIAAAGPGAFIQFSVYGNDGISYDRENFSADYLRPHASDGRLRSAVQTAHTGITYNDFDNLGLADASLEGLCAFFLPLDYLYTESYKDSSTEKMKSSVLGHCTRHGLPFPTLLLATSRGFQLVWFLKERKERVFLPVWKSLQWQLCEIFMQYGPASGRMRVYDCLELPGKGTKLLYSKQKLTSWDAMYNALRNDYYARAYRSIAEKYFPDANGRPQWFQVQQMIAEGKLKIRENEIPAQFLPDMPAYRWTVCEDWSDAQAAPLSAPKKRQSKWRAMSEDERKAHGAVTEKALRRGFADGVEDLLKLIKMRNGKFHASMQDQMLFQIYRYAGLYIADKKKGNAFSVESVRKGNSMMENPLKSEKLDEKINELRDGVSLLRQFASKQGVINTFQITTAEQAQLKYFVNEKIAAQRAAARKNKSGMTRRRREELLIRNIAQALGNGLNISVIAKRLKCSERTIYRCIKRNPELKELEKMRLLLKKKEAAAKAAQNGLRRKKSKAGEAQQIATLALQRVRRARNQIRKCCETCLSNIAKHSTITNLKETHWFRCASLAHVSF